jgi:hypothetical protein
MVCVIVVHCMPGLIYIAGLLKYTNGDVPHLGEVDALELNF